MRCFGIGKVVRELKGASVLRLVFLRASPREFKETSLPARKDAQYLCNRGIVHGRAPSSSFLSQRASHPNTIMKAYGSRFAVGKETCLPPFTSQCSLTIKNRSSLQRSSSPPLLALSFLFSALSSYSAVDRVRQSSRQRLAVLFPTIRNQSLVNQIGYAVDFGRHSSCRAYRRPSTHSDLNQESVSPLAASSLMYSRAVTSD